MLRRVIYCSQSLRIVLLTSILYSCGTHLHTPANDFKLSEKTGLAFGRVQVALDGSVQESNTGDKLKIEIESAKHTPGSCLWTLKPFTKKKFEIERKNGYFAIVLPAGKYQFVTLEHNLFRDESRLHRTSWVHYGTRILGPPSWIWSVRFVYFDVVPNRAVYMGTIIYDFNTYQQTVKDAIVYEKEEPRLPSSPWRKIRYATEKRTITQVSRRGKTYINDDELQAVGIFRSLYPDLNKPLKKLCRFTWAED